MMAHGQKDLSRQIETTIACCDKKGCDNPLWDGTCCKQCGQACSEECSFYLGALNRNVRENRWYDGKYPIRRLPKGEFDLPVEIGYYVALEDTPPQKQGDAWKAGENLFLELKRCRKAQLEARKVAQ
jgi:hypothetical protein